MSREYDIRRIEVIDDATAEMLRRIEPWNRVRLGCFMGEVSRGVVRARLRAAHPDWTEAQHHQALMHIMMADEFPEVDRKNVRQMAAEAGMSSEWEKMKLETGWSD